MKANIHTKIKKTNWGDYRVRLYVDGIGIPSKDYFTDDKEDAEKTAEVMEKSA